MKTFTIAALLALLVGCTPATPEEAAASAVHKTNSYSNYIKRNSYDVCIRGNTYLYLASGNASQAILVLDKDSKVIPCKEAQQ